ncbi:TetR/AcrR family transcriptional regulator [Phaeacidiphilus oryzae]|uniref:TetR/AcrR family transcriptional regulator n=1 Tax=Phaeacidiphilus oryzae TaxID=348818 RepID=UPI00055AA2E7|nr:TetR/AcrR family transcriptional regulator [Phaeacidiphilus oryzae]
MPARGPYRKGEAKRAEILRTALEVFANEGYPGTSLSKVAARCNLSLPGLLHYFASKEDLLTEVLRASDRAALARFPDHWITEHAVEAMRADGGTPGLVALFLAMAASAGDPDHPAHSFFPPRYERLREAARRHLRAGQEAGEVRSDLSAEQLATLMIAVADGSQLQWLADPSLDRGEILAAFVRLVRLDRRPADESAGCGP